MKKENVNRAIKPSQRESITDYSSHFGNSDLYSRKLTKKRVLRLIIVIISLLLFVYCGYFFTELLISITELPAFINPVPEELLNGFYPL